MTKYRSTELFARLSEKANLFKQYAQRTVFASAPCLSRLCRRRTSMLASYRGLVEWTMHCTVALGYCLDRCALFESILMQKILKSNYYTKLSWVNAAKRNEESRCYYGESERAIFAVKKKYEYYRKNSPSMLS